MFLAGIIPGIVLSVAYSGMIVLMAKFAPKFVGGGGSVRTSAPEERLGLVGGLAKMLPIALLVLVVLGGIYGGVVTPIEAGAAGALVALLIAVAKRALDWKGLW